MNEETDINRISRLTEAVRKARGGDYSFRMEPSGKNDELDLLADAISQMVESLHEHVIGRKTADDAQMVCEEKYRRLKANIPGVVYIFAMHPDETFSFPYVNDASRQLFGISPEDLMTDANLLTRLIHPDDRERFASSLKRSAETLQPWREELRFIVNGEVRWHDCMSRPELQPNGDILWDGIILEITERKRVEEALRDSEERLHLAMAAANQGFYDLDISSGKARISPEYATMLGYDPTEFVPTLDFWASLLHPDDRDQALTVLKSVAQGELLSYSLEYRLRCKSGDWKWILSQGRVIDYSDEGVPASLMGIHTDISERKRAEETLKQANLVVENSPVVLFRWRAAEGWPVELVSRNVTQFGYTPEEFLSGTIPFASIIHCEDMERVAAEVKGHSDQEVDNFQQEYRIVKKNGELCWVYDRTVIERDEGGKITHYQGIIIDITERKYMEQDLRLTKFCIDNAGIGIYHTSEQHIYNANDFACKSLGFSVEELRAMSVFDIDPVITMEGIREISRLLETNGSATHQTTHRRKDGTTFPVEITTNIVEFQGKHYGISFVKDITERKLAEEALLESEEKFRVLAETSPTAIFLYQGEMIIYANPATQRLFGYTADELLRMRFWDWAREDFKEMVRDRGLARQRGEVVPSRYESSFVTKSGEERWLVVSAGQIEYHGRPAGVASFLDITESKRVEGQLRDSLAEKEVLLKEVHHRVKNNLQIITTLLDLQFENIHDQHSLHALRESQDRIKAMALVHEKLYQSMDLASIDFAEYIEKLALFLFNSYAVDPEQVTLTVDVGHTPMEIDRAIPCGLIINELVSNALKYAFPAGRKGEITIRLRCGDDGLILLTVADNGIGLPPGLDFRDTETLGLQLVYMLTKQLNGDITPLLKEGAAFTIRFKS